MRTFGDFARQGRDNNFNLIRMIAASAVLVSHSFFIATALPIEPLEGSTPFKLGTQGLIVFFTISGFLISSSFVRRVSLIDFVVARVARIVPGLFGMTLVVALLIGPIFNSLPASEYFGHADVWLSLIKVPTFIHLGMQYPGIFPNNPAPAVNGSLWSLPYEIACYGATMVLGLIGLLRGKPASIGAILITTAFLLAKLLRVPFVDKHIFELVIPFALGVIFYTARDRLPLNGWIAALLVIATILLRDGVFYREIYILALCYGTFYLAGVRSPALHYNRIGDYSYGIYIYAWPMQEVVVALWPGIAPIPLTAIAWSATLPLAILSWHLIEHPALVHRHRVGAWLTHMSRLTARQPSLSAE